MKYLVCLIGFIFLIGLATPVLAATSSPSAASPSANPRAQEILNRVTNRVTEIANSLRRTYVGKIKSVGTASVVITTSEGDRTVSTNDATSFYRLRTGSRTEINFSNLKAGDDLAAMGTINTQSLEMTARQIIVKIHRYNLVGTVDQVNKNIVTLKEFNGPTDQIDLTDVITMKKLVNGKMLTAVLSDVKPGSVVFALAYSPSANATTLSALKALVYSP